MGLRLLLLTCKPFAGTSIKESRTTIQQGHNIKLLTLVSIFFLPLTFVTSVFGMTNMPTDKHYWMFAIVTATVCVPFFVLIGSLNTNKGMRFWRNRTSAAFDGVGGAFSWLARCGKRRPDLVTVKSFDSESTASTGQLWRSRKESVAPGLEVEDPATREEQQKRLDDWNVTTRTRTMSAQNWNTMPLERTSTIATMWQNERKRRLRYSEEV